MIGCAHHDPTPPQFRLNEDFAALYIDIEQGKKDFIELLFHLLV